MARPLGLLIFAFNPASPSPLYLFTPITEVIIPVLILIFLTLKFALSTTKIFPKKSTSIEQGSCPNKAFTASPLSPESPIFVSFPAIVDTIPVRPEIFLMDELSIT